MDNPVTRISVRNLVEFILQSGDLDNRRGTIDKDAMLKLTCAASASHSDILQCTAEAGCFMSFEVA